MRLVNTAIMSEPINWVKVPLMAAFGMVALYLVANMFKSNEGTENAAESGQ